MISRNYVIVLLLPNLLASLALLAVLIFIARGGELTDLSVIAESQQREGGLYGSALFDDAYQYKFELARIRKPDIVVIGSSRVLTIRALLFNEPMTNMGLVASSAEQLETAVDDMLARRRPKTVLIGVDYFWGNSAYAGPTKLKGLLTTPRRLSPNMMQEPVLWLMNGKISASQFVRAVVGPVPSVIPAIPSWGWTAKLRGDGYAPDGARIYGAELYGRSPSGDAQFAETLDRINKGQAQFRYGNQVSNSSIAAIGRTLQKLEDAGIAVITFMPPLAPSIYDAVMNRAGDYGYIQPYRNVVASLSRNHFDFMDGRQIGATDCEFVDGYHPGEVANARLLATIANAGKLKGLLNSDVIQNAIANRGRNNSLRDEFEVAGEHEVDFLKLGCPKS